MKQIIHTDKAPKALGPYSQAIKANGFVFCSGQIPLNPKTMEIVGSTIEEQTKQVCENLRVVLEEAGSSFDRVVKTTCLLKDLSQFEAFNAVYNEFFGASKPARATFEVARLPKDVLVEIELVALA